MTAYAYEAVDRSGRRRRGGLEAASVMALERTLESEGLVLVTVTEREGSARGTGARGSRRDLLEATRSAAALLAAGLPVAEALATTEDIVGPAMAGVLRDVGARIARGEGVAAALDAHPATFPPAYRGVVRAGERSGNLEGAFARLTARLEREAEVRGRILSAAIYPMILGLVGGAALLVVVFVVVPRFADLILDAGAGLPPATAALMAVSAALRAHGGWLVLALTAAVAAGAAHVSTGSGRARLVHGLLRVPVVGSIRREVLGARVARLLGSLLEGGAPLMSALDDTAQSVGDPAARDAVREVRARVREGEGLHGALVGTGFFPPLLGCLVAVGERSGQLPGFLAKAADVLEGRTHRMVERSVTLLEPAMIVVFGGLIALVAFALLQAIYGINAGAFR